MKEMMTKENKKMCVYLIVSISFLLFLNYYWFEGISEKIFLIGDDIRFFNIVKSSDNIIKTVMTNDAGVYRPVSYLAMAIAVKIFGVDSQAYFQLNLAFNMVITLSIFYFIYSITSKCRLFFSFLGSVLYITAIYSYYGITQLLGFMEQMCVFFCICFFYFVIMYIKRNDVRSYVCSVLMYFLALMSHERFLALLGVYIVLNLFILYDRPIRTRVKNMIWALLPAIFFVLMKVCLLKVPLFVGTGQIQIKFSFSRTIEYIVQSILSMLGIVLGPEYLMGHLFNGYSRIEQMAVLLISMLLLICFITYLYQCIIKDKEERKEEIQKLLSFIFIEGATIICYSISSRIEMRQIYVPYVILVVYVMYCIDKINISNEFCSIAVLYCIVIIGINSYIYRQNIDSLFFIRAMSLGKTGYESTIAMNEDIEEYKIYIEENGELTWAMLLSDEKDIFYMYDKEVEWERFDDLDVLQQKVQDDLKKGEKVKVLYVNAGAQVTALDYTDINQQVNVRAQMGR